MDADRRDDRARRHYRPKVEALEALRLLSDGLAPTLPAPLVDSHQPVAAPLPPETPSVDQNAAWDAALDQAHLLDLFGPAPSSHVDQASVQDGLAQLDRYLGRAWARAGLPPRVHEDCTQAVYATLLENLGRDGFDQLASDIGQNGIREVLSRETAEGPDFFRAVDMVKKRAQRERSFQALDDQADVAGAAGTDGAAADWSGALHEAITRSLNPREAALIQDTLRGKTPAEIAQQWGVAPKTVSNEKTRAIAKLREALVAELVD